MNKIIGSMLVGVSALIFGVGPTHANLIVNGGFEETGEATGSWFLVSEANVPGWSSDHRMEFWLTHGISSFEGKQHLELNAHSGNVTYSIWQDFDTEVGAPYQLSFAAAARGRGPEKFSVDITGTPPGAAAMTQSTQASSSDGMGDLVLTDQSALDEVVELGQRNWEIYSFDFTALAPNSRLTFTAIAPSGTMGNLLDNVNVEVVPAPSTLAIFLLGSLGLVARRHH